MIRVIGITGSFGTGKTTVAKMFSKYGAVILDADKIAHQLLKLKPADRKKLGKELFRDKAKLKKFCDIIHPLIITKLKKEIIRNKTKKLIIIDAPLLIEANLVYLVDRLIVVAAGRKIQVERLKKFKKFATNEIKDRIGAQMPLKEKIKYADFIIDNNGAIKNTKLQVEKIWNLIKKGEEYA